MIINLKRFLFVLLGKQLIFHNKPNFETGCPGMGIDKVTPRDSALGFICFIRADAVSALGLPQSSKLNKLCRTGLL